MADNSAEGRITGTCLGSEVVEGVSKQTGEAYRFVVTSILGFKKTVEATLPKDVSVLSGGTPKRNDQVDYRVQFRAGANGRLNVTVLGDWAEETVLV